MKYLFLILAVSLLLFNCDKDNAPDPITDVEFVEIGQGVIGGIGVDAITKENIIIDSTDDWSAFKTKMYSYTNIGIDFSQIEIDFNQYLVLSVIDIAYSNGGHSVDIVSIKENSKNISVLIENINKGNATNVEIRPYHVVRIAKTDKEIVFEFINDND